MTRERRDVHAAVSVQGAGQKTEKRTMKDMKEVKDVKTFKEVKVLGLQSY